MLEGLASGFGIAGDLADEHVRWAVYQEALRRGELDALQEALAEDPDHVMSSGAVVAALEQVPAAARERWVTITRTWSNAEFVARRADELRILEALGVDGPGPLVAGEGSPDDGGASAVDGWSDWLQLRAANPSTRPETLGLLAEHGRTRRIRNLAAEALRRRG